MSSSSPPPGSRRRQQHIAAILAEDVVVAAAAYKDVVTGAAIELRADADQVGNAEGGAERYNAKSTLIRDIGPGANVLDFNLVGAAAPK